MKVVERQRVMAAQVALRRQTTGDEHQNLQNTQKKSLCLDENKLNRTSYLNTQLNLKRQPLMRTKLTSDLIEQNNNLKRLKEEQNLKNLIKKSKKKFLIFEKKIVFNFFV